MPDRFGTEHVRTSRRLPIRFTKRFGAGDADANSAEASDASVQFYNAAGLVRLKEAELVLGGTLALPKFSYRDGGSTRFTGGATGGQTPTDITPDAVLVPNFYYSRPINSEWTFGLASYVPYGAKLDYGDKWQGRYSLNSIDLQSIAIHPSLAWKINGHHALGFGMFGEYMKAKFMQNMDLPGGIQAASGSPAGTALIGQIIAAGGNPAALASPHDVIARAKLDSWGFGFNLGYIFQLDERTRLGMAYRSSVHHKLDGSIGYDFTTATSDQVVNGVLKAATHKTDSAASLSLDTPETVSFSGYHDIDHRWAVMGDLTWNRTSRLENLNIKFPGSGNGDEVIRQNWRDTYRLSLGANYKLNNDWLLRTGYAFDQAPVRSSELTHPGLPDGDRNWFSVGARYDLDKTSTIDFAYSFVHFDAVTGNYSNSCNPLRTDCTGNGETTRGTYKARLQFLGLSYRNRF